MNREVTNPAMERQGARPAGLSAGVPSGRDLYSLFQMAELERRGIDFSDMLVAIRRRKWSVGLITLVSCVMAWWYLGTLTPLYPATASVVLETQQEQVIDLESVVSGISGDFIAINTETEVLRSRKLISRVVDDLRLIEDPEFNPYLRQPAGWTESAWAKALFDAVGLGAGPQVVVPETVQRNATVDALRNRLRISNVDATYVFEISIDTRNRQKSADLMNRLARLYILEQLEVKFEATQAATQWLSTRVADLKVALERSEATVEEYKSNTPLVDEMTLAEEGRKLKELRARAEEYLLESQQTEERLARVAALRADGDVARITALIASPRVTRIAEQLAGVTGSGDQSEARRTLLRTQLQTELDRQVAQLRLQLDRARSQSDAVRPAIADLEELTEKQANDLVVLRQLVREAEASRLIYEHFLSRMKEISVQEGIQRADARVLSAAIPSRTRSFPNKTQTMGLALIFGLMLGSALAIWRENRLATFRSAEDVEKATGLRVLGNIPKAPIRRRRDLLSYVLRKPSSALAESVRDLRTSLLLSDTKNPPQVIVSSSSIPREGKTTLAVLLAQNSAALGKKVLLIECDLRKRTLNAYFNAPAEGRGLISVLYGEAAFSDVVLHDPEAGLDILPGEESAVNAADVFSSIQFEQFLAQVRKAYDFIVIDTPPVMAVPDARLIAALGDALVYSVAWDRTERDLVQAGLNQFREIDMPLIGLALTQIDLGKAARYGYGGYGQYYKAGKTYYHN
ncbi:MAG: polysaccharide biosynthesis tyrosine autokinase [Pseudomonadota bacterium]